MEGPAGRASFSDDARPFCAPDATRGVPRLRENAAGVMTQLTRRQADTREIAVQFDDQNSCIRFGFQCSLLFRPALGEFTSRHHFSPVQSMSKYGRILLRLTNRMRFQHS